MSDLKMERIPLVFPEGANIILGQAHFIKSVEDLYEAVAGSAVGARFGVAFAEASGPRLVRSEGSDPELKTLAEENILSLGCGHVFMIILGDAWPIQVLPSIRAVPEVCSVFCATSNPASAVVARYGKDGCVIGVIDGEAPLAVETGEDVSSRKALLRRFGYKR